MKKTKSAKSRLMQEAHQMAADLFEGGVITLSTMNEFDALCLTETHELSASKIKKIRLTSGVSQAVFAKVLNVSSAAIKQWERGERNPCGPALKLLNLVEAKGIAAII
ncbi:MAG: helix-turn-helix domain-containing protein [Gammaproteobacteria bacterium]